MKSLSFKNGDKMPILGLGTWKANPGEVGEAVKSSIRMGYRHIDCAAIYGNETEIGEALSELFAKGEVKREDIWITSKLWNNAHRKEDVKPALQKTLSDLKLDYLDLYLIHWPIVFAPGVTGPKTASDYSTLEEVPIIETWRALEQCVSDGLCKHIGVSNFSIQKLEKLLQEASIAPESNQIEIHAFLQQQKMLEFCTQNNIHITAYSSLGSKDRSSGLKSENEPDLMGHPTITSIAQAHSCTNAQILLAWVANRNIAVIPKSVNPDRLQQNLQSAEIVLSEAEMNEIAKMDLHYRYLDGKFWEVENGPYTIANLWDE